MYLFSLNIQNWAKKEGKTIKKAPNPTGNGAKRAVGKRSNLLPLEDYSPRTDFRYSAPARVPGTAFTEGL